MANPFPFSSGAVLTAAQLNEVGAWDTWTPTWTGLTVGNGTVAASYTEVNKIVYWQIQVTFGSTTSVSGSVRCSVPVSQAGSVAYQPTGQASLSEAGSALHAGMTLTLSDLIFFYAYANDGSYENYGNVNATVPFTWGTGDIIYSQGWHRS